MGRDYPAGYEYFRSRLKMAFIKNSSIKDEAEIRQLLARGEFVCKEIEALYMLRKYRTLKKRYYEAHETDINTKIRNIESNADPGNKL